MKGLPKFFIWDILKTKLFFNVGDLTTTASLCLTWSEHILNIGQFNSRLAILYKWPFSDVSPLIPVPIHSFIHSFIYLLICFFRSCTYVEVTSINVRTTYLQTAVISLVQFFLAQKIKCNLQLPQFCTDKSPFMFYYSIHLK